MKRQVDDNPPIGLPRLSCKRSRLVVRRGIVAVLCDAVRAGPMRGTRAMAAKKSGVSDAKLYVAYWRKFRELAIAFLKEAERWKLFDHSAEIPSMPGVKKWQHDERGRWYWDERPNKTSDVVTTETHARYVRAKQSGSAMFLVWQKLDQHFRTGAKFIVRPQYHPAKYAHSAQIRQVGELFDLCQTMLQSNIECDTKDMKGVITRLPIELREQFGIIVNLLEPFAANSPPSKNAAVSDDSAFVAAKTLREQSGKRMTIDQRMKLVLFEKPESSGWSITEFQTELKCSRAGIHKTASWKALEAARKLGKAERRNDRRAKTR